jgi:hypothetical protein
MYVPVGKSTREQKGGIAMFNSFCETFAELFFKAMSSSAPLRVSPRFPFGFAVFANASRA